MGKFIITLIGAFVGAIVATKVSDKVSDSDNVEKSKRRKYE